MSDPNFLDSSNSPFKASLGGQVQEIRPKEPQGIGGWLILVAIGLVVSPIRIAASLFLVYVPIFTDGTWQALTSPSSPNYNALWAPILIFEIVANMGFVVAYIGLAILFFMKSSWFPKMYITFALINIAFIIVDAWLGSMVVVDEPMFDPTTTRELLRSVIATAIWGPYLLISKRAKNTFVN